MKKACFTKERIVRILREADRDSIADVSKQHGISDVTIYRCKLG